MDESIGCVACDGGEDAIVYVRSAKILEVVLMLWDSVVFITGWRSFIVFVMCG